MVEALGNGRYRITATPNSGVPSAPLGAGGSRIAYAVKHGNRTWVFIDGRTYVVEGDSGGRPRRGGTADGAMAFAAPMPATVVAIKVKPGDTVREGDLLIMLEAMKMELPITAPRDGRIKSIDCREHELVQPGVALLEFETE